MYKRPQNKTPTDNVFLFSTYIQRSRSHFPGVVPMSMEWCHTSAGVVHVHGVVLCTGSGVLPPQEWSSGYPHASPAPISKKCEPISAGVVYWTLCPRNRHATIGAVSYLCRSRPCPWSSLYVHGVATYLLMSSAMEITAPALYPPPRGECLHP